MQRRHRAGLRQADEVPSNWSDGGTHGGRRNTRSDERRGAHPNVFSGAPTSRTVLREREREREGGRERGREGERETIGWTDGRTDGRTEGAQQTLPTTTQPPFPENKKHSRPARNAIQSKRPKAPLSMRPIDICVVPAESSASHANRATECPRANRKAALPSRTAKQWRI